MLAFVIGTVIGIGGSIRDGKNHDMLPVWVASTGETLVFRKTASFSLDFDANGNPAYLVQLTEMDSDLFSEFTARHVQEMLEVYICDTLLMEARVLTQIQGGEFFIVGDNSVETIDGFLENGCP